MPERYRVIVSARTSADLHAIHQYIEQDSPQNAAAVVAELLDAIDSLERFPTRFPVHSSGRRLSATVRRMPVPPYLIYYRVVQRQLAVEIITVRHGKRRQPRRLP